MSKAVGTPNEFLTAFPGVLQDLPSVPTGVAIFEDVPCWVPWLNRRLPSNIEGSPLSGPGQGQGGPLTRDRLNQICTHEADRNAGLLRLDEGEHPYLFGSISLPKQYPASLGVATPADDRPVPFAERPEFQAPLSESDGRKALKLGISLVASLLERAGALVIVALESGQFLMTL